MLKYIIVITLFIVSCTLPKDKFLKDFGIFINETEANYKSYDDSEWKITQLNFIAFKEEFEGLNDKMDNNEINQTNSFINRFEKIEIRRDPLNNILKIFK